MEDELTLIEKVISSRGSCMNEDMEVEPSRACSHKSSGEISSKDRSPGEDRQ